MDIGGVAALGAAILFGIAPIFYRFAMGSFRPLEANFVRTLLSYPICILLLFLLDINPSFNLNALPYVFIVAFTGSILGDTAFMASIKYIGASLATAISYTYIVFSAIMAVFIGESVRFIHVISLIMVIVGIWLCYFEVKGKISKLGLLMSILTAFSWSLAILASKFALLYITPTQLMTIRNGLTLLMLLPVMVKRRYTSIFHGKDTLYLFLGALSGIVFGIQLYYLAIKCIGIALTALISGSSPILTLAFAYILLKERFKSRQLIGISLAIMGSYIASIVH